MPASDRKHEVSVIGVAASPGIAIGPTFLFTKNHLEVAPRKLTDSQVKSEIKHFKKALDETRQGIKRTRARAVKQTGDIVARIFDSHLLILDDVVLLNETLERIEQEKLSADYLVNDFMLRMYRSLKAQKGEYFSQRADDVLDVARRLIYNLKGVKDDFSSGLKKPAVIVANDLSPSDIIHLDRRKVLGIATDLGGATSHTAILTRSLSVPAVTGLKNVTDLVCAGQDIVINGNSGKVVVNPTPTHLKQYINKRKRFKAFTTRLQKLRGLPTETRDGRRVRLVANIELPIEVEAVINQGGEGVGLFRTEYLFLTQGSLPTEKDQVKEYRRVADALAPKPVVIRTYDLGGDKVMPSLEMPKENNPFLGWRAIRVSLDLEDLLRTQFRAILRVSHQRNVRILLPLVSCLDEVRRARKILREVMDELDEKQVSFNREIMLGVMIEVPSAALIADELAKECDFFSIGTNDLVQYTLAVDRGNENVASLYKAYHPAVLRLIKHTVEAGRRANIPVAVCGEMAGEPLATLLLVGLGLDELSVSPMMLPEVKKIIRSSQYAIAQEVAQKAFKYSTATEVENYLLRTMKKLFADLPVWFTRD